jgi:hypothetical protein
LDRYTIEDLVAPKILLRNSLKIKDWPRLYYKLWTIR